MKNFLILIAVLILGAAAYYWFVMRPAEESASKPVPTLAQPKENTRAAPPASPQTPPVLTDSGDTGLALEPPAREPLPVLMESDPLVLESLTAVIGEAAVMKHVVAENLVGRIVTTVDALTARQLPGQFLPLQPPGTPFEANVDLAPPDEITNDQGDVLKQYLSDPLNASRYSAHVELLESIDTNDMAGLYRQYQPLFEEAYVGLGYPDGGFHARMLQVIDHLLAAPPTPEPARLIKPEAYYLFVDPELESLSAGQKLMVRMGPGNALRVKEKLRELRAALGDAPAS